MTEGEEGVEKSTDENAEGTEGQSNLDSEGNVIPVQTDSEGLNSTIVEVEIEEEDPPDFVPPPANTPKFFISTATVETRVIKKPPRERFGSGTLSPATRAAIEAMEKGLGAVIPEGEEDEEDEVKAPRSPRFEVKRKWTLDSLKKEIRKVVETDSKEMQTDEIPIEVIPTDEKGIQYSRGKKTDRYVNFADGKDRHNDDDSDDNEDCVDEEYLSVIFLKLHALTRLQVPNASSTDTSFSTSMAPSSINPTQVTTPSNDGNKITSLLFLFLFLESMPKCLLGIRCYSTL